MVAVRIQAKDGNIVWIETNLLNLIPSLHRRISGIIDEQDGRLSTVHSVEINSGVLQEIIEWCDYHNRCSTEKDNKRQGNRSSWELCEWDKGFFLENRQNFDELVDAAIVLDMEHLCDACSIYVTERFREFKEYGQSLRYQHNF
nr:S phase kinase associated protein 1A [Hymenolepis microstoma]